MSFDEEEDHSRPVDRVVIAREHLLALQEEEDAAPPSWMRYLPTTTRSWSKKRNAVEGGGRGEEEGEEERGGGEEGLVVQHVEVVALARGTRALVEEKLSSNPFAVSIKSLRAASSNRYNSSSSNNNNNSNNGQCGSSNRGRGRGPKISASLRSSPYASQSQASSTLAAKKRINVDETALLLSSFSCS